MQDSEDRPQRRSAIVARDLSRLDIDIAALSEVRFLEQGSYCGWLGSKHQLTY